MTINENEYAAQAWLEKNMPAFPSINDRKRDHQFVKRLSEFRDQAIASERLACRLLAANYPASINGSLPTDPMECAEQVAAEIAKAIGARDG